VARAFLGVIVGYAIFTLSSALLFRSLRPSPVVGILCGIAFAAIGGAAAALIGGVKGGAASLTLGVAIAIGALLSIIVGPRGSALWPQLAALLLMAPAAVAGGRMLPRRR